VEAWRIWIDAQFDGDMLRLPTNGIVIESLKIYGSVPEPQGMIGRAHL